MVQNYPDFLTRFLLLAPQAELQPSAPARAAAVLVPMILHPDQPTILLTTRARSLRQHPGQVAFPGGKQEAADQSLLETALRETEEELGISRQSVSILGQLPCINSRSDYHVTPFLATLQPPVDLQPNPDEVASVFEVPLTDILSPGAFIQTDVLRADQPHTVTFLRYTPQVVWGMTASILYQLAAQIG